METKAKSRISQKMPLLVTMFMVAIFGVFFVIAFIISSAQQPEGVITQLTEDSYMEEVAQVLEGADPKRGETLVNQTYECYACHVNGAGNVAPLFDGIGARASIENPPLTAEAYLYEAIIYPTAHVVKGFSASMPANYQQRMTAQEIGDIIAYLLTQ